MKAKIKTKKGTKTGDLYNATYPLYQQGVGSLAYRDKWNLFDQMIVSYGLLGDDKTSFKLYKTLIFDNDFLKTRKWFIERISFTNTCWRSI